MLFYKTYTDEKQIHVENSNLQLDIKIIMLLVLQENALKVDVHFLNITIPIDADVNVTEKNENLICFCV